MAERTRAGDLSGAVVETDAAGRRLLVLATASIALPALLWLAASGISYLLHDFSCLAAESAGGSPSPALRPLLIGLNAGLLALTIASGVAAAVVMRRGTGRREDGAIRFLGGVGVLSAAMFGFGLVLLLLTPLIVGPCS